MRVAASSAQPEWVTIQPAGGPPIVLDPSLAAQAFNNVGTNLLFDFQRLSQKYSALRFIARVDSGNPTFTPETTYFPGGPAEAGIMAPQPFTVAVGHCYGDPYGIDEMRPYWRLWISGTATGAWGVLGIPRP
jgi:hypothetical protein